MKKTLCLIAVLLFLLGNNSLLQAKNLADVTITKALPKRLSLAPKAISVKNRKALDICYVPIQVIPNT